MENLDLLLERFAQFYELVVDLLEYSTTAKNLFKELTVSVLDFKVIKLRMSRLISYPFITIRTTGQFVIGFSFAFLQVLLSIID